MPVGLITCPSHSSGLLVVRFSAPFKNPREALVFHLEKSATQCVVLPALKITLNVLSVSSCWGVDYISCCFSSEVEISFCVLPLNFAGDVTLFQSKEKK